jgi:hypothetical protein
MITINKILKQFSSIFCWNHLHTRFLLHMVDEFDRLSFAKVSSGHCELRLSYIYHINMTIWCSLQIFICKSLIIVLIVMMLFYNLFKAS